MKLPEPYCTCLRPECTRAHRPSTDRPEVLDLRARWLDEPAEGPLEPRIVRAGNQGHGKTTGAPPVVWLVTVQAVRGSVWPDEGVPLPPRPEPPRPRNRAERRRAARGR
jgi:hypothetical protein